MTSEEKRVLRSMIMDLDNIEAYLDALNAQLWISTGIQLNLSEYKHLKLATLTKARCLLSGVTNVD